MWGPRSVSFRHFSRAAEVKTIVVGGSEGPRGPSGGTQGPSEGYQTLSDLLQEENTLSGLFESYNNKEYIC